VYRYKTVNGVRRKIKQYENSIAQFRRLRGIKGQGTFWEDTEAVDKAIRRYENDINALKLDLEILTHTHGLMNELKSSEIF